jgi:hypothetical protein
MQAIAISLLPVVATLDILRSEIDLAIGRDGEPHQVMPASPTDTVTFRDVFGLEAMRSIW